LRATRRVSSVLSLFAYPLFSSVLFYIKKRKERKYKQTKAKTIKNIRYNKIIKNNMDVRLIVTRSVFSRQPLVRICKPVDCQLTYPTGIKESKKKWE
jgi:hypothetical protein